MSEGQRILDLAAKRAEGQRWSDRDDFNSAPRHAKELLDSSHAAPVLREAERAVREIKQRRVHDER